MTEPPSEPSSDAGADTTTAAALTGKPLTAHDFTKDNLFTQLGRMAGAFWASRERTQLVLLATGLVVVVAATAGMQIRLNAWNRPFYDALERKDLRQFFAQLVVFGVIAGGLLVLNVAQAWLNQTARVTLRKGLACDLFEQRLKPRRAFRLLNAGEMGANPDQRIHEDARHLSDLSADLYIGLLQASLLLGSFIGVLWILSEYVTFYVSGSSFAVPGYMVWCALLYAGTGSWLSWRVGRSLFELNAERYAQGSRTALRAGAPQRAYRQRCALRWGRGGEAAPQGQAGGRPPRHAADHRREHEPHLDYGRVWLVNDHRANPGRRSRIFRRQTLLWGVDDGRRRLHAGCSRLSGGSSIISAPLPIGGPHCCASRASVRQL